MTSSIDSLHSGEKIGQMVSLSSYAREELEQMMHPNKFFGPLSPVDFTHITASRFQKIKLLGKGSVGKVYLVQLKGTSKIFAMKVLEKDDMIKRNKVKRALAEREILATTNHPFIVTLYLSFQDADKLYFIMEYCAGGEFYRTLRRRVTKCIPELYAKFYASEVLLALEYLHKGGFIYRDLKPENLLLHSDGHIRLADFDLSKQVQIRFTEQKRSSFAVKLRTNSSKRIPRCNSFVGTEEYLAPEVVCEMGHSYMVDWWTFGILIYEMIYGVTPFKGKNEQETFKNITKHNLEFPSRITISKNCKDLIKRLLRNDPKKRLGFERGASEIKEHPFFKGTNWEDLHNQIPPLQINIKDRFDTSYFFNLKDDDSDDERELESDELFIDDDSNDFNGFSFCKMTPTAVLT